MAVLRALVLAFLLALVGCSSSNVKPGTAPVYYSDSRSVELLPTAAMTDPIDMPQHIAGNFTKPDGSTDSFEADSWVRANDSILSITMFTGFGTTLGEITYERDSVKAESSVLDVTKMKAEYLVADFQVCFYPFAALKENFEKAGFTFVESRDASADGDVSAAGDYVRTLKEGDRVILVATKKAREVSLVNELRKYSYRITLGDK